MRYSVVPCIVFLSACTGYQLKSEINLGVHGSPKEAHLKITSDDARVELGNQGPSSVEIHMIDIDGNKKQAIKLEAGSVISRTLRGIQRISFYIKKGETTIRYDYRSATGIGVELIQGALPED